MFKNNKLHLHLESSRKRSPLYHLTEARWRAAARRRRALSRQLHVTIGWDGDILDTALATADMMINSNPPRERLRERAPHLKWIQTTGAGIDGLMPLDWLPADIVLTNNRGAHGAKAQDSCTMALLMLNADMPQVLANQRQRAWQQIFTLPIAGKVALILGFGDLGQAAGRAARRLGLKVIAVTRSGKPSRLADTVYPVSRLDQALPQADFIIVATPLTNETRGLLDQRRLARIKPDAGLVNIGRAAIIDYAALRARLESGQLRGAVLDVFETEPLPPDSPWWTTPGVVVLPHISCDNPLYIDRLFDFWFANLERFLAGRRLKNTMDRTRGY